MSDVIIQVENLGKRYSLRHLRDQRYVALRDVIANSVKAPFWVATEWTKIEDREMARAPMI
jgi:hypothetical protein